MKAKRSSDNAAVQFKEEFLPLRRRSSPQTKERALFFYAAVQFNRALSQIKYSYKAVRMKLKFRAGNASMKKRRRSA
jgi:hypothetical protein